MRAVKLVFFGWITFWGTASLSRRVNLDISVNDPGLVRPPHTRSIRIKIIAYKRSEQSAGERHEGTSCSCFLCIVANDEMIRGAGA